MLQLCTVASQICLIYVLKYSHCGEFRKGREGGTIIVLWEIWPTKEVAQPKREIDTYRLQNITGKLQSQVQSTKFTTRLQKTTKETTKSQTQTISLLTGYKRLRKVSHRLLGLLIDYKDLKKVGHRLQRTIKKSDIDYKVY